MRQRLSSAGKPLPSLEVSIRNDEGIEVPIGESGEIWVRGEQVSGEYLGQGKKLTADGWFPTNDGGSIDDGGTCSLREELMTSSYVVVRISPEK